MKAKSIFVCLLILSLTSINNLFAIEKQHPRIYCTNDNKANFLLSVKNAEWKDNIIKVKKENLEKYIDLCKDDPNWLVSRLQMNWKTKHDKVYLKGGVFSHSEGNAPVPTVRFSGTRDWATNYSSPSLEEIEPYFDDERGMFLKKKSTKEKEWVHPSKSGHIIEGINSKIMNLVEDAAFMYWLTGEKKYAEFAAPVFKTYKEGMYYREAPIDLKNSGQQRISGLATFEVIHEGIVIPLTTSYDFLFDYFNAIGYDLDHAVAVFQKWGDLIIVNGVADNNWNFFQARFLTYIALALDDNSSYKNGKGREYYLENTFDITSERQIALKEAILNYDQKTGVWPESPSYSMHVTSTLLRILTVLDNDTNINEFTNYPVVEKASLAAFQYLFPCGHTVGFGDARHGSIPAESFELLIANYRKYGKTDKELVLSGILQDNLKKEGKERKGRGLFELFFYVDALIENDGKSTEDLVSSLTTPTFYAPNVSMFIQRLGSDKDAMMVSTFGSFGNHAHSNGIAIELYANNYVLAPDMGRGPSYWHTDHRNYYSQFPAHNTVVVDGISSSSTMRGYNPFVMDNHFPQAGDSNSTFDKLSFSKVSFVEPKTLSDQQRLTAIVKSNSGKGYFVDVFRSRKQIPEKQKHEYFYHNLGQSLTFFDEDNQQIKLDSTTELSTASGDMKAYDYFDDKLTFSSSKIIKAQFRLKVENQVDNVTKLWIKGSNQQQYFSVNGPKSNALSKRTAPEEMIDKKIPALIIRKNHEAWNDPFVAIVNPYNEGENQLISDVSFPELSKKTGAQIIKIKHADGATEDFIIASSSENDAVEYDDYFLKGLLTIQREINNQPQFIFAGGVIRYQNNEWEILSRDEAVTASIELTDRGYLIQTDRAVSISVPKDINPKYLELYTDNGEIIKRVGSMNRNNANQIEFKLEKATKKALIVLY